MTDKDAGGNFQDGRISSDGLTAAAAAAPLMRRVSLASQEEFLSTQAHRYSRGHYHTVQISLALVSALVSIRCARLLVGIGGDVVVVDGRLRGHNGHNK